MLKLKDKRLFVFDLDGTTYVDGVLTPGAHCLIKQLVEKNTPFYFYSNNSSNSRHYYVNKLKNLDIHIDPSQIILSTHDAATWLVRNNVHSTYILGTQDMLDELKLYKITHSLSDISYILLGYDRELTYEKLKESSILLQEGMKLLMTHCDVACPSKRGLLPDAGSFLKLFQAFIKVTPLKVFGKPNPSIVNHLIRKHCVSAKDTVIIGDRLETDITMANKVGCTGVLVLTGVTTQDCCKKTNINVEHIIKDLREISLE